MTVSEFSEIWLETKARRLSPLTLESYRGELRRNILPFFGEMELNSIDPLTIERWIAVQESALRSPETVLRSYAVLRSFFHKARVLGLVDSNPARSEVIEPLTRGKTETQILEAADLPAVLVGLEKEPALWRLFVFTALETGARRGELVALRWCDIKEDSIVFEHSAYKLRGKATALKSTKNGKVKTVHISRFLSQELRNYRKNLSRARARIVQTREPVFSFDGSLMNPTTPTEWWSRFLRKNGLPHYKFHALRHTSASYLLSLGVDLQTVSSRLGHSDIAITQRYLHTISAADLSAAEMLSEILYTKKIRGTP